MTYEAEVGRTVNGMLKGKVIRYGQVSDGRQWFATRGRSLAGFGEAYKGVADCPRARKDDG